MSEFDDLSRRLNDASGSEPDVFAAHEHVLRRVGAIRRRRRVAATAAVGMCLLFVGTAFAMGIGNRGTRSVRTAATEQTNAPELGGAATSSTNVSTSTTTIEPTTTLAPTTTLEPSTTIEPSTTLPEAETTTPVLTTLSLVVEPNNGSHVPAPATTAPRHQPTTTPPPATSSPAIEPTTTAEPTTTTESTTTAPVATEPETESTNSAVPPADQPPALFSSLPDGNSITVRLQGGALVLVSSSPAPSFVGDGTDITAERIRVRFRGPSAEVTITVRIVGGQMVGKYETS
jgi:hypothetical protein